MFDRVHGSAPSIVGEEVANLLATVLSGTIVFNHLGETDAAETVWTVVEKQLVDSSAPQTPDLDGSATTVAIVGVFAKGCELSEEVVPVDELDNFSRRFASSSRGP